MVGFFALFNFWKKVIHLNRPLRCQACCFPCCLQELEVVIVIIVIVTVIVNIVLMFIVIVNIVIVFTEIIIVFIILRPGEFSSWMHNWDCWAAVEHPLSKVFRLLSLDFQSNRKQHKEQSIFGFLLSWLQGPGRDASWCNGDCVWINSQCNPGDLLSVLLFL